MASVGITTCKHGTPLYEQGEVGSGDWFHSKKCIAEFCLPLPFDPRHFKNESVIEWVDGGYLESFSCEGHEGECDSYSRDVAGPDRCAECGYGFEDVEDLNDPSYPMHLWKHPICPGGDFRG